MSRLCLVELVKHLWNLSVWTENLELKAFFFFVVVFFCGLCRLVYIFLCSDVFPPPSLFFQVPVKGPSLCRRGRYWL